MSSSPEEPTSATSKSRVYYQRGGVTIYHGDCREVMPTLGARSVDCVVTDPNYRETSYAWDRTVKGWTDWVLWCLSPSGSCWCFGSLSYFMETAGDWSKWKKSQDVVWEKHNGAGMHNDRFRRVHELAAHFYPRTTPWGQVYKQTQYSAEVNPTTTRHKGLPTQNRGSRGANVYASKDGGPKLMRSVIKVPSCHGKALHGTQKPEGIVAPLLRYSCPPGGVVLDPFMGSGTTLAVAIENGMGGIGIDVSEACCEVAARRLDALL